MPPRSEDRSHPVVRYHGGVAGACLPFAVFVIGVVWLALAGAPDERGFWPVLLLALSLGMLLARDRAAYSDAVIRGMSQPIVMIMIMAWLLASVIGVVMSSTGFVQALIWLAARADLGAALFVPVAFLVCCVVSTSTGTSFGTILICGPLLYPAGGLLGADLPTLAGAILGGATFGDSISPISDTSIASAYSQEADIGGTVRSRLKYVLIAGAAALAFYLFSAAAGRSSPAGATLESQGDPRGLPMLLAPAVVIGLLLARRHLLHGLLAGIVTAVVIGLVFGLLPPERLLSIDRENYTARGIVIDGLNRGLGISVFTIFLMGVVAAVEASGVLDRIVEASRARVRSVRSAETWIVGVLSAIVMLTGHSVVAILTVGPFARETGARFGLHRYRRANLLDLTVSTYPFLLPYCLPVILVAGTTASGAPHGIASVGPVAVGLHNFYSWTIAVIVVVAIVSGFGRTFAVDAREEAETDQQIN